MENKEINYEKVILRQLVNNKRKKNVLPITEKYLVHKLKHKHILKMLNKKEDGTLTMTPIYVLLDYTLTQKEIAKILNTALEIRLKKDLEWEKENQGE